MPTPPPWPRYAQQAVDQQFARWVTREIRSKVKSSAVTANGAPHALTANYVYYRDIFETDPNTSAAWTSGGVNGIQIGPEAVT